MTARKALSSRQAGGFDKMLEAANLDGDDFQKAMEDGELQKFLEKTRAVKDSLEKKTDFTVECGHAVIEATIKGIRLYIYDLRNGRIAIDHPIIKELLVSSSLLKLLEPIPANSRVKAWINLEKGFFRKRQRQLESSERPNRIDIIPGDGSPSRIVNIG